MFDYETVKDEAEWKKIVKTGEEESPFTARETGKEVEFLQYDDWDPSLYGACKMLRGVRGDGSLTTTGYVKCGSKLAMRVTQIPQKPTK